MKIRYENAVDDVAALMRHALNRLPAYRVFVALTLSLPVALFLATGVLGLVLANDPGCLGVSVAFALVWPVLFWLAFRFLPGLNARLLMRGSANRGVVGWHELELADGTLIERTEVGGSAVALTAVEQIASDDARTFVYTSSLGAHVIPRRSVQEGDYEEFVDALRREWEQARLR